MELSAEIFRTRGRAPKPVAAAVVRELDRNDLLLLASEKGSKTSAIKRLTERHHALARILASGSMPIGEAATLCGYSLSRVSILQNDPAFKELLEFYRADAERPFRDMHTRLAGLSMDAAEELSNRLEEEPDKITINQLMELTKLGADRTGFGPSATNVNVNVDLAGRLEAARKRVAMRKLTVIEGDKE